MRRKHNVGPAAVRSDALHYIVSSSDAVDEVMGNAIAAGGSVVKQAAAAQWGGYSGCYRTIPR